MNPKISLSDGEWKIMKVLWEKEPQTVAQIVSALKTDTCWTKGTVFIMLTRLIDKGAVSFTTGGRSKLYSPALNKEDAAYIETESFLSKVYDGSVGLMVTSMAGQNALTKEDINELYAVLKKAEEGAK